MWFPTIFCAIIIKSIMLIIAKPITYAIEFILTRNEKIDLKLKMSVQLPRNIIMLIFAHRNTMVFSVEECCGMGVLELIILSEYYDNDVLFQYACEKNNLLGVQYLCKHYSCDTHIGFICSIKSPDVFIYLAETYGLENPDTLALSAMVNNSQDIIKYIKNKYKLSYYVKSLISQLGLIL